jgi:transposase
MSSSTASAVPAARPIIHLGMDVHKESITIAVLPDEAKGPTRVDRVPNDLPKLKRWLERVARGGELRACYEASGAGYVLHRALREWGYACDVIAPSLIPTRPGVQRKHDKRDAADLARLHRAGELTALRIPSEADERVRDVVRCRETFQREILKSRHYILKSSPAAASCSARAPTGARRTSSGSSTSRPTARPSLRTTASSSVSITRY